MLVLGFAGFIQTCLAEPCQLAEILGIQCHAEATSKCKAFGSVYTSCDQHKIQATSCEPLKTTIVTDKAATSTAANPFAQAQQPQQRFPNMMPGLKNSGTDCFALATLQAEFASPGFKKMLRTPCNCQYAQKDFVESTERFFENTMRSDEAIVNPIAFIQLIRRTIFPDQAPARQHDSAECLLGFINQLNDQHNVNCARKNALNDLYLLKMTKKGTCDSCTMENERREESFRIHPLRITHADNLTQALQAYFTDGMCAVCNSQIKMKPTITAYPQRLLLSLVRFNNEGVKNIKPMPFPLQLENFTGEQYTLQSFHVHLGRTLTSGHYVAYVRNNITDDWYEYNDSSVRQVPSREIQEIFRTGFVPAYKGPGKPRIEGTPYILCYEQKSAAATHSNRVRNAAEDDDENEQTTSATRAGSNVPGGAAIAAHRNRVRNAAEDDDEDEQFAQQLHQRELAERLKQEETDKKLAEKLQQEDRRPAAKPAAKRTIGRK